MLLFNTKIRLYLFQLVKSTSLNSKFQFLKHSVKNIITNAMAHNGSRALSEIDPEIYGYIRDEKTRQLNTIELIASENFTSKAVFECLGSCLTNKYAEGYPGARYYGGNENVDKIETLCMKRCLEAFSLDPEIWGVNVQPYSGSPANFAAYTAILSPHDRIMGLDLPSGGHLTHGFYTPQKKVSASSIYFESLPYKIDQDSGLIDYDNLLEQAMLFRPKLIICGISAYPRDLDYQKFREIADKVGSYLMSDIAHIAGLIAGKVLNNAFEYSDIVTTTVHKTLRGPRSGIIFFNKKRNPTFEKKVNEAVFPALQGGPHVNQIAAIAVAMKEVTSPEWADYAKQIVANSRALADTLMKYGYKLITNGTDNHLILWDLKPQGLTGAKLQLVCDQASITLNKNSVVGDVSAVSPTGVRIGTPAMTTRGLKENDWIKIADLLHQCVIIAQEITNSHGTKLVDFKKGLYEHPKLDILSKEVKEWVSKFPMPGQDL